MPTKKITISVHVPGGSTKKRAKRKGKKGGRKAKRTRKQIAASRRNIKKAQRANRGW